MSASSQKEKKIEEKSKNIIFPNKNKYLTWYLHACGTEYTIYS